MNGAAPRISQQTDHNPEAMPLKEYHAFLTNLPASEVPRAPYTAFYPVPLGDGSQLNLPIEPLPNTDEAIVLLMSNQTPFAVEDKLTSLLCKIAARFEPEVIVGVPTMGLDYARAVARAIGFPSYVAFGNSRKFWYDDALSVPISSITSPGAKKRLYIDPSLVSRVRGKRALIVDDVVATGGSASAAIGLLNIAGANVVGVAAPFVEGESWKAVLSAFSPDWTDRVRTIAPIPRLKKTPGGWIEA
jgi:adenine/guanine phosphoribosyltransferase-like PRPP-binding protein